MPQDAAGIKEFGFCPKPIRIDAGPVKVRPLRNHSAIVKQVLESDHIHDGWIYAPRQPVRGSGSGREFERPYSARIFDLPKTHMIEHANAVCDKHIDYLIWALSFFLGARLTTVRNGYLDSTPVKLGKLVDFVLHGKSLEQAVELAEKFWEANGEQKQIAKLFTAAVHALFLGQNPQSLQFERFIYLYTAIDACFRLGMTLKPDTKNVRNPDRIEWMCGEFGLTCPDWAKKPFDGHVEVVSIRNATLHEALFMGEPLGFALLGHDTHVNLTLEMQALICRLLVSLIGGNASYIGSRVNTRQQHSLKLC